MITIELKHNCVIKSQPHQSQEGEDNGDVVPPTGDNPQIGD